MSSPPRRFLFLYALTGGGHLAAAQAVRDAMHARYAAAAHITLLDIFTASDLWPFRNFQHWYPKMLQGRGWAWRFFFHATNSPARVQMLTRMALPYVRQPLQRLLAAHPHQVLVSFHPIPNAALVQVAGPQPKAVVVQDFGSASASWFAPGMDRYFLPDAGSLARAQALGLPANQLQQTGLPVQQAFLQARQLSPEQARSQLGLNPQQPVVLLMGGREGAGNLESFVRALLAHKPAAQIIVLAGNNQQLKQTLRHTQARVLNFQQNMATWMRAATLLVTKAGPNTLAEAFILGLPVILFYAIPGQETANPDWVVRAGAGLWRPEPQAAAVAVMQLLHDDAQRAQMAHNARTLAQPQAADTIAQALWAMAEV